MELMKKSAGYAESQIRLLLSDLKNSSHNVKLKALKRFQEYVELYQPEVDFIINSSHDESLIDFVVLSYLSFSTMMWTTYILDL